MSTTMGIMLSITAIKGSPTIQLTHQKLYWDQDLQQVVSYSQLVEENILPDSNCTDTTIDSLATSVVASVADSAKAAEAARTAATLDSQASSAAPLPLFWLPSPPFS